MSIGDITGPVSLGLTMILTALQIRAYYTERSRVSVQPLLKFSSTEPDELLISNHGKYAITITHINILARRSKKKAYVDLDVGLYEELLNLSINANSAKKVRFEPPYKIVHEGFNFYQVELHIAGKKNAIKKKLL